MRDSKQSIEDVYQFNRTNHWQTVIQVDSQRLLIICCTISPIHVENSIAFSERAECCILRKSFYHFHRIRKYIHFCLFVMLFFRRGIDKYHRE